MYLEVSLYLDLMQSLKSLLERPLETLEHVKTRLEQMVLNEFV